jgi:hypothetical protein
MIVIAHWRVRTEGGNLAGEENNLQNEMIKRCIFSLFQHTKKLSLREEELRGIKVIFFILILLNLIVAYSSSSYFCL